MSTNGVSFSLILKKKKKKSHLTLFFSSRRPNFRHFYPRSDTVGHVLDVITVGKNWNVDGGKIICCFWSHLFIHLQRPLQHLPYIQGFEVTCIHNALKA